jgi:hypothetical protein
MARPGRHAEGAVRESQRQDLERPVVLVDVVVVLALAPQRLGEDPLHFEPAHALVALHEHELVEHELVPETVAVRDRREHGEKQCGTER